MKAEIIKETTQRNYINNNSVVDKESRTLEGSYGQKRTVWSYHQKGFLW